MGCGQGGRLPARALLPFLSMIDASGTLHTRGGGFSENDNTVKGAYDMSLRISSFFAFVV